MNSGVHQEVVHLKIHLDTKKWCILCCTEIQIWSWYVWIVFRDWELDQAGLLPQGAQMLRQYYRMMDGDRGRSLAFMLPIFRVWERNEKLAQGLSHSWFKLKLLQRRDGEARRESLVWSLTRLWPVMRGGPSEPQEHHNDKPFHKHRASQEENCFLPISV